MAAAVTFATFSVAQAGALVTSKKWTRPKKRFDFAQEIYDQAGRLVALHEKFPVDLGHKTL